MRRDSTSRKAASRQVQKARVLALALDLVVTPDQRVFEIVAQCACRTRGTRRPRFQLRGRVHRARAVLTASSAGLVITICRRCRLHQHGEGNVIGVLPDQRAQRRSSANSFASSRRCSTTVVPRSGRSMSATVNSPSPSETQCTPCSRQAGATRVDLDLVGNDER